MLNPLKKIYSAFFLAIISTTGAWAQTDTLVTRLNEVSVVGQKQNSLTDLSVSTTIDSEMARRLNILSVKDASAIVPNFYLPSYGSRMTSSIYVRGLGARIDQPVVGLSVDGVPYLNKDNYDFDLFDISKIEVLRGAQSILNGRNTMAGQINISTLSPWQYQGLRLMAEYARANTIKTGAGYYFKISPELASAVTAYANMTDGLFRNGYNNGRLDTERQASLRWKLSWHPSSHLAITNTASAQITRQGGYPYESASTGVLAYNDTCFYRRTSLADGLTVGWTGKRVLITSVTSVQYMHDNMTLDQDFTPAEYFTLTQRRSEYSVTEDLYAKGSRGDYHWLGGVFGFYKHTLMEAPVTFKNDGVANLIEAHPNQINPYYPVQWDTRSFILGSDFTNIAKGIALYQQSTYMPGRWRFELGLRLDLERPQMTYRSHCNTGYTTYHLLDDGTREVFAHTPVVIDDGGHLHHTYVQLLPKFAVGYALDNHSEIFANAAKGYKAGGFNVQMFSDVLQQRIMEMMGLTKLYDIDDIVSYKPEKSWNFELGLKHRSTKADFDATLYYIACTDQQLTAFPSGMTTGRIMTNAGRTRSYGAEASLTLRPAPAWQLKASYGYTNAKFVKYDNGREDFAGCRLPYAPANTAFISADYAPGCEILGMKPSFNLNIRGIGDIYWDDANTVRQPFYALAGASAALTHPKWSIRIWGENLTSTRYRTFYFVSMSNAFVQRGRPAFYGVTLRYNL